MRQGKGYQRRKQAIEEKESHRWLQSLEVTQEQVPPEIKVVTIGDREADIDESNIVFRWLIYKVKF